MFRAKGRVIKQFDKDARNFIDLLGLNNDSNLNVSGLYSAAQARTGINNFVLALKSAGVWNWLVEIKIFIGGTYQQHEVDLKYLDVRKLSLENTETAYRINDNYGLIVSEGNSVNTVTPLNSLPLYSRGVGIYVNTSSHNSNAFDIGTLTGSHAFGCGFGLTGQANYLPNGNTDSRVSPNSFGLIQLSVSNSSSCLLATPTTFYTRTPSSNGDVDLKISIGGLGATNFRSKRRYAGYYISNVGFSGIQLQLINDAFNNLQSSLNRNPFKV